MQKKIQSLFFVLFLSSILSFAQESQIRVVSGTVVENQSEKPIPYATVVAKDLNTNSVLEGATTNEKGFFTLQLTTENSYLEVKFMGYETLRIDTLNFVDGRADLNQIKLQSNITNLEEVEVRAERSTLEFELDKRVFNVGKDISSTGMGALEVLNNVPSVNVDIEGAITLRNNAGVQILINGKPSVLADQESGALGSITADQIEKIEVITNPSAKYQAEGSAGIINIVLKKDDKKGLNGSISANTGWPHNHSLGASMNYRTDKFNFFTQFGLGYRSIPEYFNNENTDFQDSSSVLSDGINYRNENFYNITLGTDYFINDYNVITLSGSFAYEIEDQPSMTNFALTDLDGNVMSEWEREEVTEATNPKWEYDLQYVKQFKNDKEHKLTFSNLGRYFGKDLTSQFSNRSITGTAPTGDQRTRTNFQQADYTFKVDYTNPLTEKFTLEAGSQYVINDVGNDFAVSNNVAGEGYVIDSNLTNNFEFLQNVLGVYATGGYEGDKWGLKLGLRGENTMLNTRLVTTNEENSQNYTNLFPSLHTSYKISKRYSIQAGYSRRIYRPRLWDLNPFFNIRNNFNIRQGNPNLMPEFTDSYELTGIFIWKKITLNASVYNLYTTDVIERVSTFEDNVNIRRPENIGISNTTGLEINAKYKATKWLTLTGDFNYGYFLREGTFQDQDFDFTGDKYTAELNSKFKLKKGFDIELSGEYRSSVITVQGEQSGFAFMNAGIRKKVANGKVVLSLSVRDVFATRIREFIVNQGDNYTYSFEQRGRFLTFGVSYGFGKGEAMTYSGRR
jgi:outer membrane receptor protein involved in Fe transport